MEMILQPFSEQRLGDLLERALNGELGAFHTFQAAVAFAKRSGVQHIEGNLRRFIEQGGNVRLVIGVDQRSTSLEGLSNLLAAVDNAGEIWINHDEGGYFTFHPKLYLFEAQNSALLIHGSGNLTEGGLYTNDEASSFHILDLSNADDQAILDEVRDAFDSWSNEELETVHRLDGAFLEALVKNGYLTLEAESSIARKSLKDEAGEHHVDKKSLFGRSTGRRRAPRRRKKRPKEAEVEAVTIAELAPRGFVMTLMRTDVGIGQMTPGTSRRSPEIFVPLRARDAYPDFWGWPDEFTEAPISRVNTTAGIFRCESEARSSK